MRAMYIGPIKTAVNFNWLVSTVEKRPLLKKDLLLPESQHRGLAISLHVNHGLRHCAYQVPTDVELLTRVFTRFHF